MTHHQSALSTLIGELLADPEASRDEMFRRLLAAGLQDLTDAEAEVVIGASRYERTPHRTTRCNGARSKTVATTAGEVDLDIPKLRQGAFFPCLLNPRRRVDKARYAVIATAWVEGVSTHKVDDLVKALGCESRISKSRASRICGEIDQTVGAFLNRPVDHRIVPGVVEGPSESPRKDNDHARDLRKCPEEMGERAIHMCLDALQDPDRAEGCFRRIGEELDIDGDPLRGWVRYAQVDSGARGDHHERRGADPRAGGARTASLTRPTRSDASLGLLTRRSKGRPTR